MSKMSQEARSIYVERRIADREATRNRRAQRAAKAFRVGAFA